MSKRFKGLCGITLSLTLAILVGTSSVFAFQFNFGEIEGNFDTSFSLGASFRIEDRDYNLIGKPNQPEFVNTPYKYTNKDEAYKLQFGSSKVPSGLWSNNGDDGDLNFDTGVISEQVKLTSDLSLKYMDYGLFMRGMFFYDIYLMSESDDMRVDIMDNEDAKDTIGRGLDLLDAFVYYNTYIGNTPFSIRAGRQVINWGESSYIPHGISESNPIDVGKLRSPGAELKEAYIPVGSIWTSIGFSETVNMEAFYQYEFERMIPDAPGSYFSTNDFIGNGGNWIQSGFQHPDLKPNFDDPIHDVNGVYVPSRRTDVGFVNIDAVSTYSTFPFQFNHVCERMEDKDASNNGQFGLKVSWFAEQFNYTEFGFYFLNYHSRRPLISGFVHDGIAADQILIDAMVAEKLKTSNLTYHQMRELVIKSDAAKAILSYSFDQKVAAINNTLGKEFDKSYFFENGDIYGSESDFAGHARKGWIHGYTEYPEDIKLLGLSFNTVLPNGMSVAGEYSYRMDEPLQIDDVEMIMALSGPLYDVLGGLGIPYIANAGADYYSQHPDADTPGEAAPGDYIIGYQRFDISQAQVSFTQLFSDVFGASKMTTLAEFGYVYVHDFPDQEELRFDALGTVRSGNPTHVNYPEGTPLYAPGTDMQVGISDGLDGYFSNAFEIFGYVPEGMETNDFATAFSWGYRLMMQLDYTNVFSGINITPKFTFGHDVYGNTPVPIATFMKHRKNASLNINLDYQRKYSFDIGGRMYWGAGSANRMADRDYVWLTLKFAI
jgi:hypothetical protein